MIITLIPGVSPVFPITSILPVCFILGTTAVKDGFEDLVFYFFQPKMRFLGDRRLNNAKFEVVRKGVQKEVTSANLLVGDIIKIKNDDMFPCDLLFLSSEKDIGICYISTINLNGYFLFF